MIKQENNKVKLGKNTLRMFVNKMPHCPGSRQELLSVIRCDRSVPRFQKLSDARIAFVND